MAVKNNEIKAVLSLEVNNFRKALNTATGQVQRFGRDLKTSLTTFGGRSMGGIESGFLAIGAAATAAAAGGLYAFSRAMSGAIDSAIQLERLNTAFNSITGKGSLAAAELDFVREESARLGISFVAAAEAYKGIFAASQGTLLAGKETRQIFSAIAAASSALGLSAEDTSAALLAISQMISKGKISAEELRGQLGERLPGAFKLMADAAGVSTAALDEMLNKGEVGIDLLPKFAQLLQDQYGKAAVAADGFIKAQANVKNEYFNLQVAAGQLVTNNTFVIESFKVLSETFKQWGASLSGNREQLVGLVKNGVLFLVDSIGGAIEVLRFFYNGWQGLGIAANGVVWLIIKGMEKVITVFRSMLMPLDLLLTGMEKIGAIDINPLKNWEQTLAGVADISLEDLNAKLNEVLATNATFDKAKAEVEGFRKKIAEIPAEFKLAAGQVKGETEKISQEIRQLADGSYTNAPEKAAAASKASAASIKQDAKEVGDAWGKTADGTYTNIPEKIAAASKTAATSIKQDVKGINDAWSTTSDGTFTNITDQQRQTFKVMTDGIKKDIEGVGQTNSALIEQVKANLAFLEAEAEKGNLSEAMLAKMEALKKRLTELSAESAEGQKKDIESVAEKTVVIGEGLVVSFKEGEKSSDAVTRTMLANIDKVKRAAATIKFPSGSSSSPDGYARGGNPFHGGLRGYGGGDRRLILVEDGEHVVRKEATRFLGHGFFQRFNNLNFLRSLPRFATGGPIGAAAPATAMAGGGDTFSLTINVQGGLPPATRQNTDAFARQLLPSLERLWRSRS